jgi:rfaE bifunctional protein kinase chain/domain
VLVLEIQRRLVRPGGGANPAVNIRSLGASARLLGVVGKDAAGRELRGALRRGGIDPGDLVVSPRIPTTVKTRVLAETSSTGEQQVVRLDRTSRGLDDASQASVVRCIQTVAPDVDAILLSDYKAGVISPKTIATARDVARAHRRLLTVDSQGGLDRFTGFDLVKCNRPDAEASLGRRLERERDFKEVGQTLVRDLELGCLVVTRGADGISISTAEGRYARLPAVNRTEVFDVTGAGDTAVAVLTMALSAGGTHLDAAFLANLAAGQVVKRLGVATTTTAELRGLLAGL